MHKRYGFTIVEVLVVIFIIAVLVTLGGLAWRAARNDALDNQGKTELLAIKDAIEQYYRDNGEYPWPSRCNYSSATNRTCSRGELRSFLVPKYLTELPKDFNNNNYAYTVDKSPARFGLLLYRADGTKCKVGKDMSSSWWWSSPACNF